MHTTAPPVTSEPFLTFWGAASAVSGSIHLLDTGRDQILLDCGLYVGRREEARERNGRFPFHPSRIAAVVVSHAHLDHCGNLPTLVKQGFAGPIYVTPPTRDLLRVVLADSAKIQEEDAAHLNIARDYAEPWVQPLYTQPDVNRVLRQVVAVPTGTEVEIGAGAWLRFSDVGHVLGSAATHVTIDRPDRPRTLTFSGDLGRRDVRFLAAPDPLPAADVLVCESTYGDRRHAPFSETVGRLTAAVREAVYLGGKVLIPAFSLGRVQLVVHILQQALRAGHVPAVPVFVDGLLAADIADVYRAHLGCLMPEAADAVRQERGILGGGGVEYVRSAADSARLVARPGPCVVVASSGMCDAGRIVDHLKRCVGDPTCTVVLVSYQAEGTTGRQLLEPTPTVWFAGREWERRINVVHLSGFSAHADRDEYRSALAPLAGRVGKVRLIHGERDQAEGMAAALREAGFTDVGVPAPGDRVVLG